MTWWLARGHRSAQQPSAAIDDALQDVFVECIEPGGALERADPTNGAGAVARGTRPDSLGEPVPENGAHRILGQPRARPWPRSSPSALGAILGEILPPNPTRRHG